MLRRLNLRSERGQSLYLFAVFLVVLIGFLAIVVNSGLAYGEKRRIQNAADAAALAAAQELGNPACVEDGDDDITRGCIQAVASDYVQRNLPTDLVADVSLPLERCTPPGDPDPDPVVTNCYSWPYYKDGVERRGQVEVRLRYGVSTFFLEVLGSFSPWNVGARAVAGALPITETNCDYSGTGEPDEECTIPGDPASCDFGTPSAEPTSCVLASDDAQQGALDPADDAHCIFDPPVANPDQYLIAVPPCKVPDRWVGGVDGAQAFVMGRACDALWYTGAGGGRIGAFATNGGLTFVGNKDKRVGLLGYDKARCGHLLPEPPNGDACETTPRSGPGADFCVHELIDWSEIVPLNWPVPPPPLPTPLPAGTTWDPSAHYPNYCVLLAPDPDTGVVTLAAVPGPPGVYCVTGPDTRLLINTSMTAGDGYTFFGLDGARIEVASNGTSVKFYWPSECSATRPTDRTLSFTCFGRTISGYDPLTMLYSTNSTPIVPSSGSTAQDDPDPCALAAICIRGQGGTIEGDIFAPHPLTFPPSLGPPPQTGGTVWVAGGAANAGNGFIESWALVIQGNSGSYTGTGPLVGGGFIEGPQGTLDPGTDSHCIFDPPLPSGEDPDDYLTSVPPCFYPGSDPTYGEPVPATPDVYGTQVTTIVGADVSMDE